LPKTKSWERLSSESPSQYELFSLYLSLPKHDRSIDALLDRLPPDKRLPRGRLMRLAAEKEWDLRADDYDREADRAKELAERMEIEAMRRRHAALGEELQKKALEALQNLDPSSLPAAEVRQFAVEGAKLERSAKGEPESIVEQRNKTSPEDRAAVLDEVRRMVAEMILEQHGEQQRDPSEG
jgi:hypothetical protein